MKVEVPELSTLQRAVSSGANTRTFQIPSEATGGRGVALLHVFHPRCDTGIRVK